MTNFQVYKKTLPFSLLQFLIGLLEIAALAGLCTIGFFIGNNSSSKNALIGLGIGFGVGLLFIILFNVFINNRIKAGQIGMMTKGVIENKLPDDHIIHAGLQEVKGRFAKLTAFFFVTGAIKGIFREICRVINRLGTAVGGDAGNAVTSAIDTFVQILLEYLCDCCLGWVMYRKDQGVTKSACEGAVIFFKHGKTLIRNIGRIFGMGFLSLLVIGGLFFGGSYLIFNQFPGMFQTLSNTIVDVITKEGGTVPEFVTNISLFIIVVSALLAIALWGVVHTVLIRPFILVGVLRNFTAAGLKHIPTDAEMNDLANKSPKFAKLQAKNI